MEKPAGNPRIVRLYSSHSACVHWCQSVFVCFRNNSEPAGRQVELKTINLLIKDFRKNLEIVCCSCIEFLYLFNILNRTLN
jgi:hypothetical protein